MWTTVEKWVGEMWIWTSAGPNPLNEDGCPMSNSQTVRHGEMMMTNGAGVDYRVDNPQKSYTTLLNAPRCVDWPEPSLQVQRVVQCRAKSSDLGLCSLLLVNHTMVTTKNVGLLMLTGLGVCQHQNQVEELYINAEFSWILAGQNPEQPTK